MKRRKEKQQIKIVTMFTPLKWLFHIYKREWRAVFCVRYLFFCSYSFSSLNCSMTPTMMMMAHSNVYSPFPLATLTLKIISSSWGYWAVANIIANNIISFHYSSLLQFLFLLPTRTNQRTNEWMSNRMRVILFVICSCATFYRCFVVFHLTCAHCYLSKSIIRTNNIFINMY